MAVCKSPRVAAIEAGDVVNNRKDGRDRQVPLPFPLASTAVRCHQSMQSSLHSERAACRAQKHAACFVARPRVSALGDVRRAPDFDQSSSRMPKRVNLLHQGRGQARVMPRLTRSHGGCILIAHDLLDESARALRPARCPRSHPRCHRGRARRLCGGSRPVTDLPSDASAARRRPRYPGRCDRPCGARRLHPARSPVAQRQRMTRMS